MPGFRQQAAVELTPEAAEWLDSRLEEAVGRHGRIPEGELGLG